MDALVSPFHAGEREAQRLAGVGAVAGAGIRDFMPDQHREFFARLPFVAIAALDGGGWPTPALLPGAPGFVSSPDPRTLQIAARADDPIAPLLMEGAPVGLLGVEFATRRRNRANGRVVAAGPELVVAVDQSFGNCPRYIQARAFAPRPAQADVGGALERLAGLDDAARAQIRAADTLFIATSAGATDGDRNFGVDISHRGGRPGFARIEGDTLTIPDFSGNRYFNTLGNLLVSPRAALLFVDFESGEALCAQGEAEIVWDAAAAEVAAFQGAERMLRLRVTRAWRRRGAFPFVARFDGFAPTTLATGVWG